jgi:hypothetical protein
MDLVWKSTHKARRWKRANTDNSIVLSLFAIVILSTIGALFKVRLLRAHPSMPKAWSRNHQKDVSMLMRNSHTVTR